MYATNLGLIAAIFLGVATTNSVGPRNQTVTKLDFSNFNFGDLFTKDDLVQFRGYSRRWNRAVQVAKINDYVDKVLIELNDYIQTENADHVELPSLVNIDLGVGSIRLKDGYLEGLNSLQRGGDVVVEYSFPKLKLKLPMKLAELKINYDYSIKLVGYGPHGDLIGTAKGSQFLIELELDMMTLKAKLMKYNLNRIGNLDIEFKGSIADWIVSLALKFVTPFLKPLLPPIITAFTKENVESLIDTYNKLIENILA